MCLAIPGRIVELFTQDGLRMGRIDYGGVRKDACLEWVPEALVGMYVMVHVGFALNTIDEAEAEETLKLLDAVTSAERVPSDSPSAAPSVDEE